MKPRIPFLEQDTRFGTNYKAEPCFILIDMIHVQTQSTETRLHPYCALHYFGKTVERLAGRGLLTNI